MRKRSICDTWQLSVYVCVCVRVSFLIEYLLNDTDVEYWLVGGVDGDRTAMMAIIMMVCRWTTNTQIPVCETKLSNKNVCWANTLPVCSPQNANPHLTRLAIGKLSKDKLRRRHCGFQSVINLLQTNFVKILFVRTFCVVQSTGVRQCCRGRRLVPQWKFKMENLRTKMNRVLFGAVALCLCGRPV